MNDGRFFALKNLGDRLKPFMIYRKPTAMKLFADTLKALFCLLLFAGAAIAQNRSLPVNVNKMPVTEDEFIELRNRIATSPQGAPVMFMIAAHTYQKNPELGIKFLIIAVDQGLLQQGSGPESYKGFELQRNEINRIKEQLRQSPYLADSYFLGTSPANGYAIPGGSPKFDVTSNPHSGNASDGRMRIFIRSTGADSPRPIEVKVNDKGLWKVSNFGSVMMGIRKPEQKISDDL